MSAELEALLDAMPADFASPTWDAAETRRAMAPLHGHPVATDTLVRRVTLGGVPCAWVSRPSPHGAGAIFFVHGGAFVSCNVDDYLFYAEFAAQATGRAVLVVGYRLAPEVRFPLPLADCLAAYRALIEGDQAPEQVVVMGDSCGGGMALAMVAAARSAGVALPAGVVSLSGWLDLDPAGYAPDGADHRDPFISEGFLRARAADYLGPAGDPHDPGASPARGDLEGLPPMFFQVGGIDLCRLDAERLAARAGAAGVDVQVDVVIGGVHGVQGLVGLAIPEAVTAWGRVGAFVDHCLAP